MKDHYTSREADDIANLAFISGKTNRGISATPPAEYLLPLLAKVGTDTFAKQCIPISEGLLQVESYKAFLAERRQLISQTLNRFLGTAAFENNSP